MKNTKFGKNIGLDLATAQLAMVERPECILCGGQSEVFGSYKLDYLNCTTLGISFPARIAFGLCPACIMAAASAHLMTEVEIAILNNLRELPANHPAVDWETGRLVPAKTPGSTGFWN